MLEGILFRSINSASLGLFRIIFGILAFFDVLNHYIYYHLTIDAYNVDKFQFAYYGFEWAQVFPEPWMSFFFFVLMIAAIFIILGLQYRIASLIFAAGFTYLFLLEKSFYLNHGYLFCWLCWLMALFSSGCKIFYGSQVIM